MFIACLPVRNRLSGNDNVLIFDTSDISLEFISKKTLKENIIMKHSQMTIDGSRFVGYSVDGLYTFGECALYAAMQLKLSECVIGYETVLVSGKVYMYGMQRYKIGKYTVNTMKFRDMKILPKSFYLHYAFYFRDLLIVRYLSPLARDVYTLALTEDGEIACAYSDNKMICGDLGLRTKIELQTSY